ncbi:PREDICTED: olfactory receptor 63-like [Chinchilla lanigera]|uniref:olfactory receptor 63-like n=1 Tax=Chinchilla lanigera TaxID=34839 RepID=UPI00038EDFB6|nr:PREDICTED: olfactory receptor 63-like [Chinchilla lanigera]
MPGRNHSASSEFILFGFSAFPRQLLPALFLLYLLMYLFTLLGNLLILAAVWTERRLHTPMYLFLCALSTSEILFTIVITPRMLGDLLSAHHAITFVACAAQMFFSFTFGYAHSFLLMVMGYDRYVAICHPLRYNVLMSPTGCVHLVAWSWAGGSVMGMTVTLIVFHLTFCESNVVRHILCHVFSLLKLACGEETGSVTLGVILVCVIPLIGCLSLIILSYVFIVAIILKIPSPEGRNKTFSTCVSHLTVVVVHYGFASMIYLKPKGPHSLYTDALMSTTYTVFTPFLSPIIFSLRNKELKNAINKSFYRKFCLQNS